MAFYIKSGEEFSADKNINEEAEERASVSQKSCPSIANDPLESGRHKLTGKEIPNENDASLHGNSSPGFEVAA
ncbi:MAG: hypothetical protein HY064_11875 [Bacteroidetes bacterium]|nr:hypothetical protein [Bacteroidota bacterium]